MGFRKPDTPPGAITELFEAMHELHLRAGEPSAKAIARGLSITQNTVHIMFAVPKVPRWVNLGQVVAKLCQGTDVDPEQYRELWYRARRFEIDIARRHPPTGEAPASTPQPGPDDPLTEQTRTDEARSFPAVDKAAKIANAVLLQQTAEAWQDAARHQQELIEQVAQAVRQQHNLARALSVVGPDQVKDALLVEASLRRLKTEAVSMMDTSTVMAALLIAEIDKMLRSIQAGGSADDPA